ncbi:hypothetical protein L618_000400002570 [Rhodococcus rhodochrous J45]|uniref:Uncharacterized protein n=1 Tax=Rhodococcus rhodochrous J45 TaxID=935266 RepID=A0A562DMH9_RHORH|nr:hypothetical protein L618_000400002570 [Rhodococcus rhodochrous J45]
MTSCRELKRLFPALEAQERGDWTAMRGAGNPLVDQIQAAMEPQRSLFGGKKLPCRERWPGPSANGSSQHPGGRAHTILQS